MTVALGPLALPMEALLFVLAFLITLAATALSAQGRRRMACSALFDVLVVGLIGARIGFIILYFDQYTGDWLSMLDIRDRGFSAAAGIPVALAFALFLALRRATLRRPLATAAVTALFSGVLMQALIQGMHRDSTIPAINVIRLADNQTVDLANQGAGKPRIINLWASWCPPCRREMPILDQARRTHPALAFQFVNQGEGAQTVQAYLARQSLPFEAVFLDPHSDLSRAVAAGGLPTTLFFNAQGQLVEAHMGELSRATLHRYLQTITPDEARTTSPDTHSPLISSPPTGSSP